MTESLRGRRVLVTGGATGIGAGAVEVFAREGARVIAVFNSTAPPERLLKAASWRQCDMRSKAAVDATFSAASADLGGLDVLFHAAGLWQPSRPEEITEDQLDFLLATNFKSTVWANQAAFGAMRDHGGRIINVGSSEGVTGSEKAAAYGSTKAAVHAWTRSAAKSWGRYGITVNAIAPAMATRGLQRLLQHLGPDAAAAFEKGMKAVIPIKGAPGDPVRDLGPMLAFLASEGSGFITGQLLAVDGGLMMLGA
jgi:3-oxoacyl-[acyl-carrier protein] reductase